MGIHPLALTRGLTREEIVRTVEDAAATIAIDNGPTMILVLGERSDGELLEASGVIRGEDVLVVHAAPARSDYRRLLETAQRLPGADLLDVPNHPAGPHGRSVDGLAITDELISHLAAAAAEGHDVKTLRVRVRPGGPAPLSVGEVVRFELDPELYTATLARADAERVSVSELVRRAIARQLEPTAS